MSRVLVGTLACARVLGDVPRLAATYLELLSLLPALPSHQDATRIQSDFAHWLRGLDVGSIGTGGPVEWSPAHFPAQCHFQFETTKSLVDAPCAFQLTLSKCYLMGMGGKEGSARPFPSPVTQIRLVFSQAVFNQVWVVDSTKAGSGSFVDVGGGGEGLRASIPVDAVLSRVRPFVIQGRVVPSSPQTIKVRVPFV